VAGGRRPGRGRHCGLLPGGSVWTGRPVPMRCTRHAGLHRAGGANLRTRGVVLWLAQRELRLGLRRCRPRRGTAPIRPCLPWALSYSQCTAGGVGAAVAEISGSRSVGRDSPPTGLLASCHRRDNSKIIRSYPRPDSSNGPPGLGKLSARLLEDVLIKAQEELALERSGRPDQAARPRHSDRRPGSRR
jgi:hypothetical protein